MPSPSISLPRVWQYLLISHWTYLVGELVEKALAISLEKDLVYRGMICRDLLWSRHVEEALSLILRRICASGFVLGGNLVRPGRLF